MGFRCLWCEVWEFGFTRRPHKRLIAAMWSCLGAPSRLQLPRILECGCNRTRESRVCEVLQMHPSVVTICEQQLVSPPWEHRPKPHKNVSGTSQQWGLTTPLYWSTGPLVPGRSKHCPRWSWPRLAGPALPGYLGSKGLSRNA